MTLASVITFFLLCCSAIGSSGCDQFVAEGGNFNVPLGYQLRPADTLSWMFNGNIIFDKKPGRFIVGKTDAINDAGFLKLKNLKKDQAGLYTAEVFDENGKRHTMKSTTLCVLDPVKKPTLNITCLASEVVFTCSHDPGSGPNVEAGRIQPTGCSLGTTGINQHNVIQFKWLQDGKVIVNETKMSLTINSAESENMIISCEVYNQASSEKSGSFSHGCVSSQMRSSGRPHEGIAVNWLFIIGGAVLIIIILCCIRLCVRRKEGTTMRRSLSTQQDVLQDYMMDTFLSNLNSNLMG